MTGDSLGVVRCVHKVGRGVTWVVPVLEILEDIRVNSRLLAKNFDLVFAYRHDLVPERARDWVLVVFEVEERQVDRIRYPLDGSDRVFEYLEIATPRGGYLPIRLLGFRSAPGYPEYTGPIAYIDC